MQDESFKSDSDEVDERKYLRAYWRADEGRGNKINDVFDLELHLEVAGDAKSDAKLTWRA